MADVTAFRTQFISQNICVSRHPQPEFTYCWISAVLFSKNTALHTYTDAPETKLIVYRTYRAMSAPLVPLVLYQFMHQTYPDFFHMGVKSAHITISNTQALKLLLTPESSVIH